MARLIRFLVPFLAVALWLPLRSFAIGVVAIAVFGTVALGILWIIPASFIRLDVLESFALVPIALGNCLNVAVVVANRFKMPVRCSTAEEAEYVSHSVLHKAMDDKSRLAGLGDRFTIGVAKASVGDLLVFAGLGIVGGVWGVRYLRS